MQGQESSRWERLSYAIHQRRRPHTLAGWVRLAWHGVLMPRKEVGNEGLFTVEEIQAALDTWWSHDLYVAPSEALESFHGKLEALQEELNGGRHRPSDDRQIAGADLNATERSRRV